MIGPTIRVVGPNPALDRIQVLDELRVGAVNRSVRVLNRAGGKSLIVARAVRRLGGTVTLYGFLGGWVGRFIRDSCAELGITDRHIPVADQTRITQVLVEPGTGRSTVVNEPGPVVGASEAARLLARLERDCRPGDLVVCTGSLAPGLPEDYHAQLVDCVRGRGARPIVDTSGPALAAAVARRPWLVKPNLTEFGAVMGGVGPGDPVSRAVTAMAGLVREGTQQVIVTLGRDGLLYADAERVLRVHPPRVAARNSTGAGDVFLGAYVLAEARGEDRYRALRWAVAASAASVARIEPDLAGPDEVARLADQARVTPLPVAAGDRGAR